MHSLQKVAVVWLPSFVFYTTCIHRIWAYYPVGELDRAYWTFLESPAASLWIPIIIVQLYALLQCHRQLLLVKKATVWSLLPTLFAIQGLTILSAWSSLKGYTLNPQWPLDSISLFKPFCFVVLCRRLFWRWTCMGSYQDEFYDETTRSILDAHGSVLYRFSPTEDVTDLSWRDLVIRLAYIHVIDNSYHVIWLRFFYEHGPYTEHINNSELLTLLLFAQICIYSYARRCTHAKLHFDTEMGLALDEKHEK